VLARQFELSLEKSPSDGAEAHTLALRGFFDAHAVAEFEQVVDGILNSECHDLVLDLKGVRHVSSAAIGAMMFLLQQIRRKGGTMVLVQPTPRVSQVLELLGFTTLLTVAPTCAAALELISRAAQTDKPPQADA
jgi:stage II sporulation protein AA (anti-sigma F factor antagonist)